MAYTFTNKPFKWTRRGIAPTDDEIALGLQGGMGLPAEFVNGQWSKTYLAVNEIQSVIEDGSIFKLEDDVVISNSLVVGAGNTAKDLNTVLGKYSKSTTAASPTDNTGDLLVVGNGIQGGARSNAFRVTAAGQVMGTQAYTSSGADFAECFEWLDGNPENEDRRGRFVTLDGEKIRLANADDDYILGVVSATPTVIGDAQTDDWHGKYVTDVFGARVLENDAWRLSDGFEKSEDDNYTSRLDRPEWAAIGLIGKLIVVDDGSCEVNGYCSAFGRGIATRTDTGYRVLARMDNTHVKILLK